MGRSAVNSHIDKEDLINYQRERHGARNRYTKSEGSWALLLHFDPHSHREIQYHSLLRCHVDHSGAWIFIL